jgi:prepilin-type N-terminal cleavage/methylation domain-containing protein
MKTSPTRRSGFTLLEILAVLALLGLVATVIATRVTGHSQDAQQAACEANKGQIELQAEIWHRNTGSWPATDLSDIGASLDYFPSGLPICPIDSNAYTFDPLAGRVSGHDH